MFIRRLGSWHPLSHADISHSAYEHLSGRVDLQDKSLNNLCDSQRDATATWMHVSLRMRTGQCLVCIPCLQAWGLFELQRGNVVAAVLLLERCVAHDPSCSPVLKWKAVRVAQQTVTLRRQRSLSMQSNLNNFA